MSLVEGTYSQSSVFISINVKATYHQLLEDLKGKMKIICQKITEIFVLSLKRQKSHFPTLQNICPTEFEFILH